MSVKTGKHNVKTRGKKTQPKKEKGSEKSEEKKQD